MDTDETNDRKKWGDEDILSDNGDDSQHTRDLERNQHSLKFKWDNEEEQKEDIKQFSESCLIPANYLSTQLKLQCSQNAQSPPRTRKKRICHGFWYNGCCKRGSCKFEHVTINPCSFRTKEARELERKRLMSMYERIPDDFD